MSEKKERRVSKKYAKRHFNAVGLFLILYILFVLLLPFALHTYWVSSNSSFLHDDILYFGIYFIILLFGTLIPFSLMRLYFRLPMKKIVRSVNETFVNLFVQAIVCFTICIGLTYVSNILFAYFGLEGKLISGIGLSFDGTYLEKPLYLFMLLVVTPILEEFAFRGVLLNTLSRYGKIFGLYANAILFALAHFNFSEMIPAFAMGYVLGKTALRYKSIIPTIIIHILFNVLLYLLCVIPASAAIYIAYALAVIFIITMYLILTGRYQRVKIQKQRSYRITNILFYSRVSVILAMMLMIADTLLMTFFN